MQRYFNQKKVYWGLDVRTNLLILHHKNNIQTLFKQLAGLHSDNELSCPTQRRCIPLYMQA